MSKVIAVDAERNSFNMHRDLTITPAERASGPPKLVDGITAGTVTMEPDSHHGVEMHPDGDELLYVISGRLRVTGMSDPQNPVDLGVGAACIIKKGEWHRVDVLERTQLLHCTSGPDTFRQDEF